MAETGNGKSTLTTTDLRKSYKKRKVVQGVSLEVNSGEVVGLLGPNGAGKTTCFYMVVGLVACDGGEVYVDGQRITHLPIHRRARLGLGYLPQEASVFRNLTVRQNLDLVLEESGVPAKQRADKIASLLKDYGIEHLSDVQGVSLSGGERRRVEIARCLALEPSFILLDEPFSGIDPIAVADLQTIIRNLRDRGYGVLLTDHNVRETLSITDRTYLIHDGRVFLHGLPDEIANNQQAKKFYLGEDFSW